jgi:hypothetical protein
MNIRILLNLSAIAVSLTLTALVAAPTPARAQDSNPQGKSDATANKGQFKIDSLKRDDYIQTSCGCAYYAPTAKREDGPMYMFINQKGEATTKVDGKVRNLKLIKEERVRVNSKNQQDKIGAGDKVLMTLTGAQLSTSITNTAERNCVVSDDCERFTWQSQINYSEFDSRKSIKAWAVCGCPGRKLIRAEKPKDEDDKG